MTQDSRLLTVNLAMTLAILRYKLRQFGGEVGIADQVEFGNIVISGKAVEVPVQVAHLKATLRQLDRREWGLWVTAIIILLLLCFAVYSFTVPSAQLQDSWLAQERLAIGVRALLALVLLFCVFAIYQQYLIKNLRVKLEDQIAVVSDLHIRAETFERLAILDPLTGLFNRRFAYEHLPRELARAERTGAPFVVVILDLDDFKFINDKYGHAAGDAALEAFAARVKRAIRSSDFPVRMGGDEFLIALPDCNRDHLNGPLSRIQGCVVEHNGNRIEIKFSAGIAEHIKGQTVNELLERADEVMYKMKHGRLPNDSQVAGAARPD